MYIVKYGGQYLHFPMLNNFILSDLSCQAEENNSGYCDFTIHPSHPLHSKLKERDTENPITVYEGDETDDNLLFYGYIYELGADFQLNGSVKCRGILDYLSSSRVRPYSTLPGYRKQVPNSIDLYFQWLIDQHNAQVEAEKQFIVGINQGYLLDDNNYIFRESSNYPTTYDEIREKILEELHGYIRVRIQNGIKYIDLLSEWTETNTQVIDFGKNLLDYNVTVDADSIATFVIPTGASMQNTDYEYYNGYSPTEDVAMDLSKTYFTYDLDYVKCEKLTEFEQGVEYFELISKKTNKYAVTKDLEPVHGKTYYVEEWKYNQVGDDVEKFTAGVTYYEYFEEYDESDKPLTLEGYPDYEYVSGFKKQGDVIYNESAVNKYGWIGANYENSDITTYDGLIRASIVFLRGIFQPVKTIEIKAIDLHLLNPSLKPIKVGEYLRMRSLPHGEDSYFLCTGIDLNLNSPDNSSYTFGVPINTLTGMQTERLKALNKAINSDVEAASEIGNDAKIRALNATSLAISGAKTATNFISLGQTDSEIILGDQTKEELGNNVYIDENSVQIRETEETLASFTKDGTTFFKDGNELVKFGLRETYEQSPMSSIHSNQFMEIVSGKGLNLNSSEINVITDKISLGLTRFTGNLNSLTNTTIAICDWLSVVSNLPIQQYGYIIHIDMIIGGRFQVYRTIDNKQFYRSSPDSFGDTWTEWKLQNNPTKVSELDNDSGYVKNTDLASSEKAGLIRTGAYGFLVNSIGRLYANIYSEEQYRTDYITDNHIISKGTLKNILAPINDRTTVRNAVIVTEEDDTVEKWVALGTGIFYYIKSQKLIEKPTDYGFLINLVISTEVKQIWFYQSSGHIYHRGGNVNGWKGNGATTDLWRMALDSVDVIDNLTNTTTWKALSANQGKVLREKIESLDIPDDEHINGLFASKISSTYGAQIGKSTGLLIGTVRSAEQFKSDNQYSFVSKGTLKNLFEEQDKTKYEWTELASSTSTSGAAFSVEDMETKYKELLLVCMNNTYKTTYSSTVIPMSLYSNQTVNQRSQAIYSTAYIAVIIRTGVDTFKLQSTGTSVALVKLFGR